MVKITVTFTCSDCLGMQHEVVKSFTGNSGEETAALIHKFIEELNNAGWKVIKTTV